MAFEQMWFPFMAILLLLNGSFVAMSFLPATQGSTMTLGDVWGTNIVGDMNGTLNIFGTQIDQNMGIAQNNDTNTEATTDIQLKVDQFKNLLFGVSNAIGGAIGIAFGVIKFFGQVLFGYFLWLDFLLNPAWHPLVGAMNLMLKTVFFLIEIIGLSAYARNFFVFRNLF